MDYIPTEQYQSNKLKGAREEVKNVKLKKIRGEKLQIFRNQLQLEKIPVFAHTYCVVGSNWCPYRMYKIKI